MENSSKRTAIKFAGLLLAAALCTSSGLALAAQVAGRVVHLSGPLMVKKADGTVKVLALNSEVEQGDTLEAAKNTYAMVRFIDNSEKTLRPNSTLKIEEFSYDSARPEADRATFTLVKGGLRSVTGLLGKRNRDKFALKTPAATIGIRGTTFVVQWVEPPPPNAPVPATPTLPPGLHLSVTDGAIIVTNNGGALGFQAGQFGYVPTLTQPPVIVPTNPGLQFSPPPSFSGNSGPSQTAAGPGSADTVDCEVR